MSSVDLLGLMPQQRDIVTTLEGPLFVSAGAGSGKTFTLTRRILWALSPESGPFVEHLDQVLAITFTNDAAAEIRERVRGALIDAGMEEESLLVDDAWISTIHGMCSRILRAHALELGIDPQFEVLEEPAAGVLLDQAIEHVLARVFGRNGTDAEGGVPAKDAFAALLACYPLRGEMAPGGREAGVSVRSLVKQVLELAARMPQGLDDVHFARGSFDLSALADAYRPCLEASPSARTRAREALDAIEAFENSEKTFDDLAVCMLACQAPRVSKAFPKDQSDLLKAEAVDAFINAAVACVVPAMRELLDLCRMVETEYRALKDASSLLDNNDLLRRTSEAFRDHPSVREAYAGRFKMVMIDEFQDTDQQQVDLIMQLAGPGARALCTVGDAQQSIYRFRGADVEVFRRQERAIAQAASSGSSAGSLVKLVRNFRSHAEILEYVAQVFDGERGGLMRGFLDLEPHEGRKDSLVAAGASRRQAVLVTGGRVDERRTVKAAAIARRFRSMADAGQPVGGMVLLLGGMTHADVYAAAFRAEGLDCVISGGSVFASAPEVLAIQALVRALANPLDAAGGLAPLLASPMFALGVQEFLALATSYDAETGETSRRNLDYGLMTSRDAPGFGDLPLLDRAREILRHAFARTGHDSFSRIACDVVNESGWLVRLEAQGAQGRAEAANVLKALDVLAELEGERGNLPRQISLAFDAFLEGKEAPGALNEGDASAVRIMTVHSSKGLEFPVVAVSDCFDVRVPRGRVQMRAAADHVDVVALPQGFPVSREQRAAGVSSAEVEKYFKKLFGEWMMPELMDDVCATGSACEEFFQIKDQNREAELEERARLLYVAMTRAREALILAMDASADVQGAPKFADDRDLTGAVLERILPGGLEGLDSDHLVFEGSCKGDFEHIPACGPVDAAGDDACDPTTPAGEPPVDGGPLDTFTLVRPRSVYYRLEPVFSASRDSYSYSSMAAALHEADEDRAPQVTPEREDDGAAVAAGEAAAPVTDGGSGLHDAAASASAAGTPAVAAGDASATVLGAADTAPDTPRDDPFALGSAFHAAAQWLIETASTSVPEERADALARFWSVTPAQRERFTAALARWENSDVRAELLSWPRVQAEVPFFSLGIDEAQIRERFGAYAEGAIDALATDPADMRRALVIDYKTGGSVDETAETLQQKHALQAKVYADVLHKAGFAEVELKFVRVEIDDPAAPGQPQVVSYRL